MARWKDCLGNEWEMRLTVADLKPLRELGLDASSVVTAGEKLADVLFGDPDKFCRVAHRLSRAEVPVEQFAAGLDGPAMEAAGVALVESIIDFFPRSRLAAAMKGRVKEAITAWEAGVVAEIESSGGAGSSPASSVPTPAR
jgi:hypothetical protein